MKRHYSSFAVAVVCVVETVFSAAGGGAQGLPANVLVNNPAADSTIRDTQSGTAMVTGPGGLVLVGFNDSGSNVGGANHFTGWSRSTDGGDSFTDMGTLPNTVVGDAGFPAMARDAVSGNIYFSALGFSDAGFQVFRSTDAGLTFGATPVHIASGRAVDIHNIAVDNFAGAGQGKVYLTWRDFTAPPGIYTAFSTNGGATFSPPALIEPAVSNVNGPTVAIGADHTVYVAYLDESTPKSIKVRKSIDLGATFAPEVTAGNVISPDVNGNLGLGFTAVAFPKLAVNPVNGTVYVVYPDVGAPGDRADIYFTQSIDGGATWSPRVRVNNDITSNDQFQPVLAVTPDGSRLFVGFYDRRNDPANSLIEVYGTIADASAGAVTLGANFKISTESFPAVRGQDPSINPNFMGHYDNATADNSFFYYPWGDNRLGNSFHAHQPDVRLAKIPVGGIEFADVALGQVSFVGGNDAALNPDECNTLSVALLNQGTVALTGVTAALVSNTPELTVDQPVVQFSTIDPGTSVTSLNQFRISTSDLYPCFQDASLTLLVESDQGNFSLPVSLPGSTLGLTLTGSLTFENSTPIPIPDNGTATSNIVLSGFNESIAKATVALHATHTFDGDLRIQLVSPAGTTVTLIDKRGGSGDNLGTSCAGAGTRLTFDDEAATAVSAGTAPFAGSFRPETPLDAITGEPGDGTWKLIVSDTAGLDVGTLQCWSITLYEGTCAAGDGTCQCVFGATPSAFNLAGGGESAVVSITSDCAWTPVASVPWIVIDSFSETSLAFHVEPNPDPAPRAGTIGIGTLAIPVNQAGGCTYTLDPAGALIPAAGGSGGTNVNAPAGCSWSATVDASWVVLGTSSGTGPGTISYTVQANPSTDARSALIHVEGQTHQVIQWGDGPDMTGNWTITPLTCKTKTTGIACKAKAYFSLSNIGTRDALKFRINFYLSADGTLNNAVLLKSQKIKKLKTGASLTKKASLKLPAGTGPGMFIVGVIDQELAVPESNRTNNMFISPPLSN